MDFELAHRFDAPPDDVARAYTEAELYAAFAGLPRADRPEVLERTADGDRVHLRVRWFFSANLSSAARAVIDPSKLSWIEESAHDLTDRSVTFRMVPDHYRDRFSCAGTYRFEPDGDGTVRRSRGTLRVKAPLVARTVEGAIVDGLDDQLGTEVTLVEEYLAARP